MSVKNLIKSTLVFSLLITSSVTFARQQMQKRTPEERAKHQTMWMQKNLAITDDQSKKVYDIILTAAKDAENANAEAPGREKKNEKLGIKTNMDTQLQAVLTGEQYQKYTQHMQEMKERMQQRGGGMQQGGN